MEKEYYIIEDNRYSTTAIYKDKRGKWIYSTTYMSGYGKGFRKEITYGELQDYIKKYKLKRVD